MRHTDNSNRRTKALTLVEMVVAISMMVVVLATIVPALAGIRNSWDTRQGNAQVVQNARVLTDHFYRHLATAEQITAVSSPTQDKGSIEFVGSDGQTYRYEVGPDGYVRYGLLGDVADLAGVVSRFQFTCYDGNDFDTPTQVPAEIQFVTASAVFANTAAMGFDKTFSCRVYVRRAPVEPEDQIPFEPGIAVEDTLIWSGSDALIDSYRSSEGSYSALRAGVNAAVSTNSTGSGRITLFNGATISGDLYIGPGGDVGTVVQLAGGAEVAGTQDVLEEPVDMPVVTAPRGLRLWSQDGGQIVLTGSESETFDSDWMLNKIQLFDNSTLVIDGDVTLLVNYEVEIHDQARIEVLPGSSLTMYVRTVLTVGGSARINESSGNPAALRVNIVGTNKTMCIEDNGVMHAIVQNPNGDVVISQGGEFFGKLKAYSLEGEGKIHVDQDSSF